MEEKDIYKLVLNSVKDGVYYVDNERRISCWNQAAESITGFSKHDVVNRYCYDNILNHVDDTGKKLCMDGCPLHETLKDGKKRMTTVYLQHKDGHRIKTEAYIIPIIEDDEIIGAVETFNEELSEDYLKLHMEELKVLAYRDQLTQLPNRRYIDKFLEDGLNNSTTAIGMIDIDHFKKVNDEYGHQVGDEVLQLMARVFQNVLKANDFVGRWGGEEFMIILQNTTHYGAAATFECVRMLVENSVLRKFIPPIKITVSIGGTMSDSKSTPEKLVKKADDLLYLSKSNGRNRVTFN